MRTRTALAMLLLACLSLAQDPVAPLERTTIGMRVLLEELPIPGSQLEPKPVPDGGKADAVIRLINVFSHGSGFRYNLEFRPYVAGTLDLRDFLQRVDGSSMEGIPALPIEVTSVRPKSQIQPTALTETEVPWFGGYTLLLVLGGIVWVVGLFLILFAGRKKRSVTVGGDDTRPETLADRLRPLVEAAKADRLDSGQRAELERLLLAHWRRRRNLGAVGPAEAIRTLREDEEAGPLMRRLEEWLHRPGPVEDVDVVQLLEPYRDAPVEEPLEEPAS